MIKKIKLLTNIFLKDYYQNLNIIKNKKLNKNSTYTWLIIIFVFALLYLSFNIINFLQTIGKPILFLKIYLPIIANIMIIQLIVLVCRIFYYSKDLEYIIPLPLSTVEVLLAKLNSVIIIMYFIEIIYLLIPLLMYGILEATTIVFFITVIMILIIFPLLFVIIISIIMLFVMKIAKFVRRQEIFQIMVVFLLTLIVSFTEISYIEKIILKQSEDNLTQMQIIEMKTDEINKMFFVINPIIKILESNNFYEIFINLIKVIIINIIAIIFFILIGKKLYLKNILQNKNIKKINANNKNKYKVKNKILEYIKIDIKKIIRNSGYFIQYIFQFLCIIYVCIAFINIFLPVYIDQIYESKMLETMPIDDFKLQAVLIVVGILQLILTFANLSITAMSREGKNVFFMKYIPISLYKQFKAKTLPQIFINIIVIILILNTIYFKISEIGIIYYIITFIISMILNIIDSYISLLLDLKNPNLNWTNQESILKNNKNKLYQYILTILIFLFLSYFSKIFKGCNFIMSIIIIIIIFLLIIILLKKYIKKNINKLFEKIK